MLERAQAAHILRAVAAFRHVCIAFSGGADSTALLLLAAASGLPTRFSALIVDHGLRPESAQQAQAACAVAQAQGISARVLVWEGAKPASGIQAAAREARYRLMAEAAREIGAQALLTGHQLDDVAETFLMRLARGSGPDGLAGIPEDSEIGGLRVLRPLLGFRHAELVALCERAGVGWIEDPSNHSAQFERARLRQSMGAALGLLGIEVEKIGLSAARLARARAELEAVTLRFINTHVAQIDDGFRIGQAAFLDLGAETRVRVLAHLLPGAELSQAERLAEWIGAGDGRGMTLSGQRIGIEGDFIRLRPEGPRKGGK